MKVRRTVLLIVILLLGTAICGFTQDRAKPRGDGGKGRPPAEARPDRGRQGGDRQQPGRSAERQPDRRQAERRHPQPAPRPDMGGSYRYRDHQFDHRTPYLFPRRYDGNGRYYHRYYRHQLIVPHFRGWLPDMSLYFYWPFYDQPMPGCGWYWVPTVQVPELDEFGNIVAYRYYRWRYVYLCVEGDRLGW